MRKLYCFKLSISLIWLMGVQLACVEVSAQNLVKNPSFEEYKECPSEYGRLQEVVPSWFQPTTGSTDYFNTCSLKMSTKKNFSGGQPVFDGQAYAGMYAYAPMDYREYLTAQFKEPLQAGKKYVFSFQVSLAEASQYGVNEFGIFFSGKPLDFHTKRNIPVELMPRNKYKYYTVVRNHKYYADKNEWTEVTGVYLADGSEQYMTFGNFKDNKNTAKLKSGENLKNAAYYYVDMVSVKPFPRSYELDEVYVLENLGFEVDDYVIREKARPQLEDLAEYLKAHRAYTIGVYGHTDSDGAKSYNKELSAKRANAVAQFLIQSGLAPNRIVWQGFGDYVPLAQNETDAGRKTNRRVEFVLSK